EREKENPFEGCIHRITKPGSKLANIRNKRKAGDAQVGSHDSYALQGVEMKLSPSVAPTSKVCLPVQYSQAGLSKSAAVLAEANYDFSIERRVLGMDAEGNNGGS
ncbi:hypothetical protein Bbelb_401030, partial [Branchiostoma belcheri]